MGARPPDMNDWYSRQGVQVKGGGLTLSGGGSVKAGQTSFNVGTGFFLGYSGTTPVLSVGNPAGHYLKWDGSTLTIKGSITLINSIPYSSVSGGPPTDADNTNSAINATTTISGGGITMSFGGSIKGGQTDYATGTGFFLGYSSGAYKFSIGTTSAYMRWNGSALDVLSNGTSKFSGNFGATRGTAALEAISTGITAAGLVATGSGSSGLGVDGSGGAYGVKGTSTNGGWGVYGFCSSGIGTYGESGSSAAGAYGVQAVNTAGGDALYANSGGAHGIYGYAIRTNGDVYIAGAITTSGAASFGSTSITTLTLSGSISWNGYSYPAPIGNAALFSASGWLAYGNGSGQIALSNGTICTNLNTQFFQGYIPGNLGGQIPISNSTVCTNLNADMLDGNHATAFQPAGSYAASSHTHDLADITVGVGYKFQYSTDGVNWTNIYLKRINW